MDVQKAALDMRARNKETSFRNPNGEGMAHAAWMLDGIVLGYVQHEKAHRWLGYAQAIMVFDGSITLGDAKKINVDA